MKTATIKTPTAELLIIELPENVKIYKNECDEGNHIGYSLTKFGQDSVEPFGLIDGYTILGKPDEIREDVARELVKKMPFSFSDRYLDYTPYIYSPNHFKTAKESLLSLLESEIYWDVNPLGIYEPIENFQSSTFGGEKTIIHRNPMNVLWHEAESRTFDRNRTLIFVKN